jgi:predicted kinase
VSQDAVFTERGEAVIDALRAAGDGSVDAAAVIAGIAQQAPNPGAALAVRLAVPDNSWSSLPVSLDVLVDYASQETARAGMPRIGCEHLVVGLIRIAADADAALVVPVQRARSELQALISELAGDAYRRLPRIRPNAASPPCAVVLCGLPGTGKSTLADLVAERLGAPSFAFDWFLGALTPFGVVRQDNAAPLGNQLITSALARQIRAGQSAVLDAGGFEHSERTRWRTITERFGGRFVGVECICPDEVVHRRRVESRRRDIPGWPATVSWEHIGRMREIWEPWHEPHLVLDTLQPLETCLARIVAAARN